MRTMLLLFAVYAIFIELREPVLELLLDTTGLVTDFFERLRFFENCMGLCSIVK